MQNKNEWYTFSKDTISIKACNKIKKLAANKWASSKMHDTSVEDYRKSAIVWCDDQWLYDLVWPYMAHGNYDAGWRYDIKTAEPTQITRYRKGGFYNWHWDGYGDHLSAYDDSHNDFLRGYVRKLSMSVILNNDFKGGDFEFVSYDKEHCKVTTIPAEAGSIILFPSSMEHRVTPVTKGIRYSLVIWFLGPPFV